MIHFAARVLLCFVFYVAVGALTGCASLPSANVAEKTVTQVLPRAAPTELDRISARSLVSAREGESGFRLIVDATQAIDARLALARHAQRSLDVQYYLFRMDAVGTALLDELAAAAKRGVRVRLLVDDLHVDSDDAAFLEFAKLPNAEVRLFNPLPARNGSVGSRLLRSVFDLGRINHRMHNKLFVADDIFSISGGRNVGAEYFMLSEDANFIDMDVLMTGPLVNQQSRAFDDYWNSPHSWPVAQIAVAAEAGRTKDQLRAQFQTLHVNEVDPLGYPTVSHQLAQGRVDMIAARAQVWTDDPDKIARETFEDRFAGSVTERTLAAMDKATREVVIVCPYFIPGELGMSMIQRQRGDDIRITVLTNSLEASDEPFVHLAYARYRTDLLRHGVEIYELGASLSRRLARLGSFGRSEGRLHAKLTVMDSERMFIGSMNLDSRSAGLNTETGLLIDSKALVSEFLKLMPDGKFRGAYRLRLAEAGGLEWEDEDDDRSVQIHRFEPRWGFWTWVRRLVLFPLIPEEQL